jgi:putative ubiquitin-RnfH superfamily antitoxin RatB of RatAB toxin-antitoxin module
MSDRDNKLISVEVAYALPGRQCIKSLKVEVGCTALAAVIACGIVQDFPELDPATADMGIFSKKLDGLALPLPADYQLKAGDRVEIYRALIADPKAARKLRAARVKAAGSAGKGV